MELLILMIIITAFTCVFTLEVIAPASKNSCDRRWMILASCISLFQSITTIGAGLIFVDIFSDLSVFSFNIHNMFQQGMLGFLLTSFVAYWWHRSMHKFDLLWRVFHQLHHKQNYGLAIWDLLFGTFSNPKGYIQKVGFDETRENRVYDMLKTKDVYKS
ncbi:hypothetical protein C3B51_16910 [Pseudoalteromonas rubra]|uniref:Uncharacterized protein n=1 Tax=Pseudoalteromonas rubra TaxID=43658 RepID=A0A4Q7E4T2_9GAMM|nr:sterol desaturase family protein [Pseudoalteromonas rubra]RZM77064.1 hypothetical protein C3B51_16910 [Pseudoalteromonas rubra]